MTEPRPSQDSEGAAGRAGRGWSIAGIVCGVLTVLQIIPIVTMVFGPLGILFGVIGYRKGDRGPGRLAIIISAAGLVVGLALIIVVALAPPPAN